MGYKMGACKGCKQRREALAKIPATVKHYVAKHMAKTKGKK